MSETQLTKAQSGEPIRRKLYELILTDSLREQLQQKRNLQTNVFAKVCKYLQVNDLF